jgi:hypothetical protein
MLIAQLLPRWRAVGEDPAQLETLSVKLNELVDTLKKLWSAHLALEEEVVIPAMRRFLSLQELGVIAAEMRIRRPAIISYPLYHLFVMACLP